MHRTQSLVLSTALIFAAGSAFAQAPTPASAPKQAPAPASAMKAAASPDSEFAQKAAIGGAKEVTEGKFAATRSKNADVKALGNRLVKDHSAANKELTAVMKTKHIPAGTATKEPEPWRTQTGAAFDRAWVDHVIEDHEKDIAEFEKEANSGSDPELKAWASGKLPTLREHLKMAQDAKAKLDTK
jgi:putative membrane protein